MNNRIYEVRRKLGLTQDDFAKKLGLSRNFIYLIEKGEREPSTRTISDICREFRINEHWLRTGEGKMIVEVSEDEELSDLFSRLLRDDDDETTARIKKRVIASLLRLGVDDWKKITAFAKSILDEENKETE